MPHKRSREGKSADRKAYRNKKRLRRGVGNTARVGAEPDTVLEQSSWKQYWDLAVKCWRDEQERRQDGYVDGSGVADITLPLSSTCDVEKWKNQPLVKCILGQRIVKEAVEQLKKGSTPEDIEKIFQKDGKAIVREVTTACEEFFGVVKNRADVAGFHSAMWGAMVRYFNVKDSVFVESGTRDGFPVGISEPLPTSEGLHPKTGDPQVQSFPEDSPVIPGNYPSEIGGADAILSRLIEGEISRSWMDKVAEFEPGVRPARLALIPKKNFDDKVVDWTSQPESALRKSFRVVEDYKRNCANNRMVMGETNSLPTYESLARLLTHIGELERVTGRRYIAFESDVQSAYRTVPVSQSERKFLVAEVNSFKVRHTRLPMGLRSSAYIFSRLFSSLHRILRSLMNPLGAGGLSYLDDNFWVVPECVKGEAICILLLVPAVCGVDFAWEKVHVNASNSFGGFAVRKNDSANFEISIPQRKHEKVREQISSMLESGHVRADALQSLIGRLLFYTQMCPIYREGLSCLYSTSNIMEKKKLNRVRCSARVTGCLERWMEVVSSEFTRVISSAEPGNDSERPEDLDGLILGDASTSALGCIALPRKGRGVYCRLNVEDLRDLEEVNIHERTCGNMVALELTATLMGIMLAKKIGLSPAKVLILSYSKSGVGALKKSFSAKIGPARLVAAITQIMSDGAHISALTHTGDKINHIKGLLNVEADKISRDPNYAPPGLEEHRITVREIEAALSGRM